MHLSSPAKSLLLTTALTALPSLTTATYWTIGFVQDIACDGEENAAFGDSVAAACTNIDSSLNYSSAIAESDSFGGDNYGNGFIVTLFSEENCAYSEWGDEGQMPVEIQSSVQGCQSQVLDDSDPVYFKSFTVDLIKTD